MNHFMNAYRHPTRANVVSQHPSEWRADFMGEPLHSWATLVVDDNDSFRSEFVDYLNDLEEVRVVGEARDGEEAIRKAGALRPDLVLMDLSMPRIGGFESTKQIKARYPDISIVIVTIHEESSYRKFAELCHADGLVCKSSIYHDIPIMLRHLASRRESKSGDSTRQG